jgi:hypothetical protein
MRETAGETAGGGLPHRHLRHLHTLSHSLLIDRGRAFIQHKRSVMIEMMLAITPNIFKIWINIIVVYSWVVSNLLLLIFIYSKK